ncbi:MAE_28990/MAE_18760 family HEPN-like nuclease [Chryseobacterium nepalense]|uniref:MAE_28990/MAE_18760 family HEPN-like nuclease n=1 Tax=Chryseobacterium nepalense TaxID=1854498 RepID=A0ABY4K402_9FLAO|nr:MAE_28990/MAE_18760 family HEPN-like nuclease [Chryseobacterium nepalense]UPQ75512.1 MAE_28990/MAE_18760 family HEPN-like nuclease [Chryseobacterium nepalense]
MPYNLIRTEVGSRFLEVNNLLSSIKSSEESILPPMLPPVENKIVKGLFYVLLYASIEYTFSKLTTHTLTIIKNNNIRYLDLNNKFYTVALASNLQSIKDCTPKAFLDKSADLFILLESTDVSSYSETFINQYLKNIWGKSFNQLTKTIGISPFVITPRELTIFDEIVENRNIVAHGRDFAQNIGSSPNYTDLKVKVDIVFDVLSRFIDHFENFYVTKEFIKPHMRTAY